MEQLHALAVKNRLLCALNHEISQQLGGIAFFENY